MALNPFFDSLFHLTTLISLETFIKMTMEEQPAKRILSKKEKIEIAIVTIAFSRGNRACLLFNFGSAIRDRCRLRRVIIFYY